MIGSTIIRAEQAPTFEERAAWRRFLRVLVSLIR
jgi:hypothetical protein